MNEATEKAKVALCAAVKKIQDDCLRKEIEDCICEFLECVVDESNLRIDSAFSEAYNEVKRLADNAKAMKEQFEKEAAPTHEFLMAQMRHQNQIDLRNEGCFKKKFRWYVELENSAGEYLFGSFVKLIFDDNALRPLSHTRLVFRQFFTMYDESGMARRDFDRMLWAVTHVDKLSLRLYDGCGTPLETWTLTNAQIELDPTVDASDDDSIIADWIVTYDEAKYESASQLSK
jgi:hypothetical protein